MNHLFVFFTIIGGIALFLFGLKFMSEGFQKLFPKQFRHLMYKAQNGTLYAVASGFATSCAMQSSSAAAVMVVSFVSAGFLTLSQALGVLFGINLGATTTSWIISLCAFNTKLALLSVPFIGIGFFSQLITGSHSLRKIGEFMMGFGILLTGLAIITAAVPSVAADSETAEIIARFGPELMHTRIMLVLIGTVLTVMLQSSNAIMAVLLICTAKGILNYPTACALVLGLNLGTTITASLAALKAPLKAQRAAFAHILFNLIGILWAVVLFYPLMKLSNALMPGNAFEPETIKYFSLFALHIAAFHTVFNVINTSAMLVLKKWLERFIIWLKPQTSKEQAADDLIYLSVPFSKNSDLAVLSAVKQTDVMALTVLSMLHEAHAMLSSRKRKLTELCEKTEAEKAGIDVLQEKLLKYLSSFAHEHLTRGMHLYVFSLFSAINHLERMAYCCDKIVKLYAGSTAGGEGLPQGELNNLKIVSSKTQEIVQYMQSNLTDRYNYDMMHVKKLGKELNTMYYNFRLAPNKEGEAPQPAAFGALYYDLLTYYERISSHSFYIINVLSSKKK